MAYCSVTEAKEIVGQDISQVLLDEAEAIVHQYTPFRWAETTEVYKVSGDNQTHLLSMFSPIISITSIIISIPNSDTTFAYTEGYEYEVREEIGAIYFYSPLPMGNDNITITYTHGFTSAHARYDTLPIVKGAEARIALYLKKNPGMLSTLGISGANLQFGNSPLDRLLMNVPRPVEFTAV